MIDQASMILNLLLGLMTMPGPGKQAPVQQLPTPSDEDVQRARQNSLGTFGDSNPLSDIYFGFPTPGPTSMTPSRPMWMAQAPALDPRMQQMLENAERGRAAGPSQQYFRGQQQPQAPAPQPQQQQQQQQQPLAPNAGETESQMIDRMLGRTPK